MRLPDEFFREFLIPALKFRPKLPENRIDRSYLLRTLVDAYSNRFTWQLRSYSSEKKKQTPFRDRGFNNEKTTLRTLDTVRFFSTPLKSKCKHTGLKTFIGPDRIIIIYRTRLSNGLTLAPATPHAARGFKGGLYTLLYMPLCDFHRVCVHSIPRTGSRKNAVFYFFFFFLLLTYSTYIHIVYRGSPNAICRPLRYYSIGCASTVDGGGCQTSH